MTAAWNGSPGLSCVHFALQRTERALSSPCKAKALFSLSVLHSELSQSQGCTSGRHRWTSLGSLHLRILLYLEVVHHPGSLLWDQASEKPVAVSFSLLWEKTLLSPGEFLLLEGGINQTTSLEISHIFLPTYNRNALKGCLIGWGKSE